MNALMEKVESVMDDVHPDIYADYKSLKNSIKRQKEDNEIMYKNLATLKRDTNQQR